MNKTVLITGASSGIGFELAKLFVQDNYDLVLIAKNKEKLQAAAKTLQKETITLHIIDKDLSDPKAPDEIYKELAAKKISIDVLINNAGFASYGQFTEIDLQEELNELQVNIVTLTHLTKLFSRDMVAKDSGRILNVASTAAFLPGPLMAVYYASKAYVLSFSEALTEELRGTGVSVSVLCPGPTNTGFVKRGHLEQSKLYQGKILGAAEVADAGYKGLMSNQTIIIPGLKNQLLTNAIRFIPRNLVPKVVKRLQEKIN